MNRITETDGVWRLEGTQMEVEVILASKSTIPGAPVISTVRLRYPRIIHSEIMTHRVFGRNARSSRAVPIKRMIAEIEDDPFVPWHWGKNQKGMQAGEDWDALVCLPDSPGEYEPNYIAWTEAAAVALEYAKAFEEAGYHKQIVNRLLEPFMYIDVLITTTNWSNFLWLRDHEDAEPHLQDLARMVKHALDNMVVHTLEPGMWHLPYITNEDMVYAKETFHGPETPKAFLRQVSAARCARISYAPFDGDASYDRELERYNTLVSSDRVHASPLEHQATPDELMQRATFSGINDDHWRNEHLSGNLDPGWLQARKLVPNEARMSV